MGKNYGPWRRAGKLCPTKGTLIRDQGVGNGTSSEDDRLSMIFAEFQGNHGQATGSPKWPLFVRQPRLWIAEIWVKLSALWEGWEMVPKRESLSAVSV